MKTLFIYLTDLRNRVSTLYSNYQTAIWLKGYKNTREYIYEGFIREYISFLPSYYRISDFWYKQVSSRLFPRNKWATKVIPRTWADKTSLIPDFLYASIVHYIEGEKALEILDWSNHGENGRIGRELKECYDWIKVGRPALLKKIDEAHPPIESRKNLFEGDNLSEWFNRGDVSAAFDNMQVLEAELERLDTQWLTWIVVHRDYLWT